MTKSCFPRLSEIAIKRLQGNPDGLTAEEREHQNELRSIWSNAPEVSPGQTIVPFYASPLERLFDEKRRFSRSLRSASKLMKSVHLSAADEERIDALIDEGERLAEIRAHFNKRALATDVASTGGYLVGESQMEIGSAIRNNFDMERLGATMLFGLTDNISFTQGRAEITTEWTQETGTATAASSEFRATVLTPKAVCATVEVSMQFIIQGDSAEMFIRSEIGRAIAQEIQRVTIAGRTTGNMKEPIGILATVDVGSVVGGTNGAAPTYDHLTDLEYKVTGEGKSDRGTTGWLVSPYTRRKLRRTAMFASGSAPIWSERESNRLLGHAAGVTHLVPDTLTKGSATGVCSAIGFVEFSELFIGLWGPGIHVNVDPFTRAQAGKLLFHSRCFVDGGLRSPQAAAVMLDALCA